MSFRDRMRISPSSAEILLRIELQRRGIAKKLLFDKVIILEGPLRGKIFNRDKVMVDMLQNGEKRYKFTSPDALAPLKPIYLDGPPHLRRGVKNRDDQIDALLKELDFEPVRFSYSPPLSNKRRAEICDAIEELEPK